MKKVLVIHEHDPNFPLSIIDRIKAFLSKSAISLNSAFVLVPLTRVPKITMRLPSIRRSMPFSSRR